MIKTVEAQGYSKEKALDNAGLDISLDKLKNATQAWKKAGSPMSSKALNQFVMDYFKKYKNTGIYLVIEASSDDTRLRPYTVINETTKGKRKATTTYQIKEADFKTKVKLVEVETEEGTEEQEVKEVEVLSLGIVAGQAARKDEAMKLMKELIEENKRDYVIEIVKEITEGQKYAGYGEYTPSKSAKLGKFMFFVNE